MDVLPGLEVYGAWARSSVLLDQTSQTMKAKNAIRNPIPRCGFVPMLYA
jgi:hypothetical protein